VDLSNSLSRHKHGENGAANIVESPINWKDKIWFSFPKDLLPNLRRSPNLLSMRFPREIVIPALEKNAHSRGPRSEDGRHDKPAAPVTTLLPTNRDPLQRI